MILQFAELAMLSKSNEDYDHTARRSPYLYGGSSHNLLPKGMQYPTFNFILDVLEKQNKIMFDKDGSFFWLGSASQKLEKSVKTSKQY